MIECCREKITMEGTLLELMTEITLILRGFLHMVKEDNLSDKEIKALFELLITQTFKEE